MSKKRTTISLHEGIIEMAHQLMQAEHYSDFSGFIEQLIRDKHRQQQAGPRAVESYLIEENQTDRPASKPKVSRREPGKAN